MPDPRTQEDWQNDLRVAIDRHFPKGHKKAQDKLEAATIRILGRLIEQAQNAVNMHAKQTFENGIRKGLELAKSGDSKPPKPPLIVVPGRSNVH